MKEPENTEPGAMDGVCRPVECPPEVTLDAGDLKDLAPTADEIRLAKVFEKLHRNAEKAQRQMMRAYGKMDNRPRPKHPKGATKATIESRKIKNRKRRKAQKGRK